MPRIFENNLQNQYLPIIGSSLTGYNPVHICNAKGKLVISSGTLPSSHRIKKDLYSYITSQVVKISNSLQNSFILCHLARSPTILRNVSPFNLERWLSTFDESFNPIVIATWKHRVILQVLYIRSLSCKQNVFALMNYFQSNNRKFGSEVTQDYFSFPRWSIERYHLHARCAAALNASYRPLALSQSTSKICCYDRSIVIANDKRDVRCFPIYERTCIRVEQNTIHTACTVFKFYVAD